MLPHWPCLQHGFPADRSAARLCSDTLLLDEPFTGMDPDTLAAAAALLRERCGEKPVLLATHDREAIRLLGWPVVELENA